MSRRAASAAPRSAPSNRRCWTRSAFRAEAAEVFDGELVVAADLDRVVMPKRR
ncbi:hypothetical protein [Saccharothrix lopnurensis]|uniref:Uncharacterized protein n=1 Tax=Saccharothrix lopnurensis TaxID=1670621 RepID=A0ABW1P0R5_9PSEU